MGKIANYYKAKGNEIVDVTDRIENYEKGKTWECDCGQGFGVKYGEEAWRCPSCGKANIDEDAGEREPPEREEEQTGLNQFL